MEVYKSGPTLTSDVARPDPCERVISGPCVATFPGQHPVRHRMFDQPDAPAAKSGR